MRKILFQKYKTLFIVLSVLFLSVSIASFLTISSFESIKSELSLVYVENIEVDDEPHIGEPMTITIRGYLCCPCYRIATHTIDELDLINHEIQISLWQVKVADVCLQVVVYYEYDINVILTSNGIWTIKVNSKSVQISI